MDWKWITILYPAMSLALGFVVGFIIRTKRKKPITKAALGHFAWHTTEAATALYVLVTATLVAFGKVDLAEVAPTFLIPLSLYAVYMLAEVLLWYRDQLKVPRLRAEPAPAVGDAE